jgi:hypothetical protein
VSPEVDTVERVLVEHAWVEDESRCRCGWAIFIIGKSKHPGHQAYEIVKALHHPSDPV